MTENILQLHDSAGLYGAETVILSLSKAMRQTKYNPILGCIMTNQKEPELAKVAETSALDVVHFPMRKNLDPFVVKKIHHLLRKRHIKLIHAHGYKSNLLGLIASKAYGIPIITTNHLFPPMPLDDRKLQLYSKFDAYFTMKQLDKIVAVSEEIRQKLLKTGLKESNTVTIENGIDLDLYGSSTKFDKPSFRRALGISSDSLVIGSLGRLTPQKGYTFLLEAARKILSNNIPFVLLIAGDGFLRAQLEEYAAKLAMEENVKFVGFRKDPHNLLKIMDIFVLSSFDEGLPMGMLEAMAARIPVVVTSVGDIPKVIQNNKNGILVQPENSDMLAERIAYLLNNTSLRYELSRNAFETVSRYHSKEAMCNKYLDLYESLT